MMSLVPFIYKHSLLTVLPVLGFGAWWLVLFGSTPIFVIKQLISVVQLVDATQKIVSMDRAARALSKTNSD